MLISQPLLLRRSEGMAIIALKYLNGEAGMPTSQWDDHVSE
jgi:hypothetical protein